LAMKKGIHPEYYPDAKVVCSCGNTWTTGSTKKIIRTDVCSACHPFYTGEQRIVDTEGQVERFMRRLRHRDEMRARVEARQSAREELKQRQKTGETKPASEETGSPDKA